MIMKKGFTLIELLTVIIILGIIVIIAVPSVSKYVKKTDETYYQDLEKIVELATVEYLTDTRKHPKLAGEAVVVTDVDIVSNKYMESIVDTENNACTFKVSSLKIKNNEYKYEVCLKCGSNYSSEESICQRIESYNSEKINSVIVTGKDIENKTIESGVWTHDNVLLTGAVDPEYITGGYIYQWYKDDKKIDGANEVVYSVAESGNYTLEVKNRANRSLKSNVFEVKIDRIKPEPPIILSDDNIAGGQWHNKNYILTLSGANNISGNIYYYDTNTVPKTEGNRINVTEDGIIIYYAKVCSGAGLCSDNSSYISKLDTKVPTIKAKSPSQYISYPTDADPLDYFEVTYGESGGKATCTVSNLNKLSRGSNTVTCTATGNNNLTASASTIFKHEYNATRYCTNGGVLQGDGCYYAANADICGNDCIKGCDYMTNPCKTKVLQCKEGYINGSCIQYKCTRYKSCYSTLCAGGLLGNTVCFSSYPTSGGGLNYTNCKMQMDSNFKITWCCQEQHLGMCRNVMCGTETYASNYSMCESDGLISSECSKYTQVYSSCATKEEVCMEGLDEYNCSDCKYETPKSCTKDTKEYLKYSCPSGGTLNGTVCRF